VLDESRYDADSDRFLVVPPLRARTRVEALREAVADGTIDTIGSDDAQALYHPDFPPGDFRSLPYGFRGIDLRVPLVLSEVARRGVSLERLADLLAGGAARAFGSRRGKARSSPAQTPISSCGIRSARGRSVGIALRRLEVTGGRMSDSAPRTRS
jgi:dihydroorotase